VTCAGAALLLAVLGFAPDPEPGARPRLALLVASDHGLPGEEPLRQTGADADRLAGVLVELGGFAPGAVRVLKDRTAADVLDAIDAVARTAPASMLFFYFSGHADAAALHPEGTLLPVDLLLHRLRSVGAELRVAVLDACGSGGGPRPRGSSPAPPFPLSREEGPTGDVLIVSSAEDEQAFEGDSGGVFTVHFGTGLRGAADADGDGQVTIGEAYGYAYAQTLRSTLAASTGPQHARFQYRLEGRRDAVLTRLVDGARLTLRSQSDGAYVIFDARERSVVAELPARAGEARRLALAPGGYVIQQRGTRALRAARVQLERGDDRVLDEHQMHEVPLLRLAQKGTLGLRRLTIGAGTYASALGADGALLATLGVEWEGPDWTTSVEAAFSRGEEEHSGLPTRDDVAQVSLALTHALRRGVLALRLGPAAGLGYVRQDSDGYRPRDAPIGSVGVRARLDLEVLPTVGLFALVEARYLLARMKEPPRGAGFSLGEVSSVPWFSFGLGLRTGF